ncbi:hypothetical protein Tco_1023320, partial [Tanacetum coccineum]
AFRTLIGRNATIQTEIRQVEQRKLQCEQMLGLFWEHPPALDLWKGIQLWKGFQDHTILS